MKDTYATMLSNMQKTMEQYPWEDKEFYANYLAQTYYFVCHSTRLLAISSGRFTYEQNSFHKRFLTHIEEEKNHEVIALSDLKSMGYTLKDFPESSFTKAFYESQYYKVEHQGALSFFGYILTLEGVAMEVFPAFFDRIHKAHGDKATKFLKLHIEEDCDHIEKAWKNIEALPELECKKIIMNALQTADLYIGILDCIQSSKNKHLGQEDPAYLWNQAEAV